MMPSESSKKEKKKRKLGRETPLYIAQRQTYIFPEMCGLIYFFPLRTGEATKRHTCSEKNPSASTPSKSNLGQPTGHL